MVEVATYIGTFMVSIDTAPIAALHCKVGCFEGWVL